jgi:serine/threonine protein kinase
MRSLTHDSIASLYWIYEDDTHVHLVMDLIEGETLFDALMRSG